ncbi:amidohydrolase family protein [Paraglaciecola sp.]|uniref:amidohydrolase family protein n=1 Tax=Paraglaciecola sp. TaxID=1920173 RepID=UPI003EF33DB7
MSSLDDIEIVDSHQHFWQLERGDYNWLNPELGNLYRDFLPKDFLHVTQRSNITHSVLVQAADTDAETQFLLSLAESNPFIAGLVGWIDMEAEPNEACLRLTKLARHPKFKGIRPMLQDIANDNWILSPSFKPIFEYLIELDLSFDALVKTRHLKGIVLIAKQYPRLKIVINHCAKPDIGNQEYDEWAKTIAEFETLTNVFVKVSGLQTEAKKPQKLCIYYAKYFKHIHAIFGEQRMMWGSDWPVVNINSSYKDWLKLTEELISGWPEQGVKRFFSGTAIEFYKLN